MQGCREGTEVFFKEMERPQRLSRPIVTWVLGMKSFKGFSVPTVNLPKPDSLAGLSISRVSSHSDLRDS